MAALTYAVLQVGDTWQIVCDRRRIGHFATRDEASRLGAMLAHEATVSGHDVEMLVQGRFGELHGLKFSPHDKRPAMDGLS
jgi:hypothetical protein